MQNPKEGPIQSSENLATISTDALHRLKSWGLTEEQVSRLRAIAGSYEYGNCLGKIESIHEVYVTTDPGKPNQVIIPHMYDAMGRKTGGQCGDITALTLFEMGASGFMDELRDNPETSNIHFTHTVGQSRTHFNMPGSKHVWTSLIRATDRYGKFTKDDTDKMVVVDGAFQEISVMPQNGYKYEKATVVTNEVKSQTAQTIALLRIKRDPNTGSFGADIFSSEAAILGLSAYKRLVYSMAFTWDEKKVLPVIKVIYPSGNAKAVYFNTIKEDFDVVQNYPSTDEAEPTDLEWDEIWNLSLAALKIKVKFDPLDGIAEIMTKKWA